MTRPPFRIGNLGEIALACRDYPAMLAFYRDVLGLEFMAEPVPGSICFFRLADGYLGHTQVLALFAGGHGRADREHSAGLHHLALGIASSDQQAAHDWLLANDRPVHWEEFPWIGWRGLFTTDPDRNSVELVAYTGPTATSR